MLLVLVASNCAADLCLRVAWCGVVWCLSLVVACECCLCAHIYAQLHCSEGASDSCIQHLVLVSGQQQQRPGLKHPTFADSLTLMCDRTHPHNVQDMGSICVVAACA